MHDAQAGIPLTTTDNPGVSVVICTRNGASRLPETLRCLALQEHDAHLHWEVIVVDNGSTDDSTETAMRAWPPDAAARLRVVPEPAPGTARARERGLKESRCDIVAFVDDDNWVFPDWLQTGVALTRSHPGAAAIGGFNHEVLASEPPAWFNSYREAFAVGSQGAAAGDVTWAKGYVWTAGMFLRRSAWLDLIAKGFKPLLTGRTPNSMMAGEDVELCYALRSAGWRLWYDPALRLRHYMPPTRLSFDYLRRLQRGAGACSPYLDPYYYAGKYHSAAAFKGRLGRIWTWKVRATLESLSAYAGKLPGYALKVEEGDHSAPRIDYLMGRLLELLKLRGRYDANFEKVLGAPWLLVAPNESRQT